MELLELYKEENRNILYSMSWLNKNSIFDKSIGSFQEIDLFTFLENINNFDYDKDIFYDDVHYIIEYTKDSIMHLINNINKEIKREHKIVPISQAKEFDKKTIIWLSRQDGRTVKEKLKNNKIKAVKRYSNVDTYENRVFKIFLKKLILIDEARKEIDNNDYLIGKIRQWLRSDDAKAVNEYGNIVYNNILLHHPHYSKIFKGYKWLNRLDEKVQKYQDLYPKQIIDILTFSILEKLQFKTTKLVLPNNLKIKHDEFNMSFNEEFLPEKIDLASNITKLRIKTIDEINFNNIVNLEQNIIDEQLNLELNKNRTFTIVEDDFKKVFIDLFRLFPIAKLGKDIINFPVMLKQQIDNKIVNGNNTKIIDLNYEIHTLPEILKTYDTDILRYFLEDFKKSFKDHQINYIIPDYVSIFEFVQVKKQINSYFKNNRSIPKSILAGMEPLFNSKLQLDDTLIYIQKNHDNDLYVTPLLVKYDEKLQLITNGFYLEKHPTKKLKDENDILDELDKSFNNKDLSQKLLSKFLQNGIKGIKQQQIAFYFDENIIFLKNNKNIFRKKNRIKEIKSLFHNKILFKNEFIELRDENKENLYNFEKLLDYEKDGFILWKEHLPRLAMGNMPMNGYFDEFILVNDESKVINGNIEIKNHFIIPANTKELTFPLTFGDENINYEAYITSNELPFRDDVECELELTYNYEAETPYKLIFIPLENKYKPLNVRWREIKYEKYDDLPIPSYPPKKHWQDLEKYQNNKQENTNLLEWIKKDFKRIIEINIYSQDTNREEAILDNVWDKDINGKLFQEVNTSVGNVRIYHNRYINHAKKIIFNIEKKGKFYRITNVVSDNEYKRFIKSMRFPLYTIWKDGNSLSDIDAPNDFKILALKTIEASIRLLRNEKVELNLKKELFLFLSVINRDAPVDIINTHIEFLKDEVKIKKYRDVIPYAIGCINNETQKKAFNLILKLLNNSDEKIYSNVLKMLNIILWRCEDILTKMDIIHVDLIINKLLSSLKLKLSLEKELIRRNEIKSSVIGRLELLLAMLRYRKIELVFKPDENITKEYIKIVDKISKYIIENKLIFNSRIQLNMDKPKNFKNTPDLLYALRIYLSSDTHIAHSIQVLGVSDD